MNELHEKNLGLERKSGESCSQNPLQIIFYVALIMGAFAVYRLFTGGGILNEKFGPLTGYSQQIVKLLTTAIFVVFYCNRSIAAWWVALFSIPAMWIGFLIFQSFQFAQLVLPAILFIIIVVYLAGKYKPYKEYITEKMEPEEKKCFRKQKY